MMARKIGKKNVVLSLRDKLINSGLSYDAVHMLEELERDCVESQFGRVARVSWWCMARDCGFDGGIGANYTWKTGALLAWYGAHWSDVDSVLDHYFENFGYSPNGLIAKDGETGTDYVVRMVWFAWEYAAMLVCEALGTEAE